MQLCCKIMIEQEIISPRNCGLALKVLRKIAADNTFNFLFLLLKENMMTFHVNPLPG